MGKNNQTALFASALTAGIAVLLSALVVTGAVHLPAFSILPGFEGLDAGVEGIEISSQFCPNSASAGAALPSGYAWVSNDARYPELSKDTDGNGVPGKVRIETRSPYPVSEPFTVGKTVDYWIKDPENPGQYLHVTGKVVTYNLPITVAISDTWTNYWLSGGRYPDIFRGEKVWFALGSTVWDQATQEQSPISGRPSYMGKAWEAPIYAVISEYSVSDPGIHYKVEPRVVGRELTLYSSPSQSGVISDLWNNVGSLNQTFASDVTASYRPDSRMQEYGYFALTLEDFGEEVVNAGLGGAHCPVANYVVKVYALQIGEFTYTNIDDTPWKGEEPDTVKPIWAWFTDPIVGWFSNPLNIAGFFTTLGVAIIVLLILIFGLPAVVGGARAIQGAMRGRRMWQGRR